MPDPATPALGQLARVFDRMAREIATHDARLPLQIEAAESKKVRQVAEITDSDCFQELQRRAKPLRSRAAAPDA